MLGFVDQLWDLFREASAQRALTKCQVSETYEEGVVRHNKWRANPLKHGIVIRQRLHVCFRRAGALHDFVLQREAASRSGQPAAASRPFQPAHVLPLFQVCGQVVYPGAEETAQKIADIYLAGARATCIEALAAGLKAISISASYCKNTSTERRYESKGATSRQKHAGKVHGLIGAAVVKSPMLQFYINQLTGSGAALNGEDGGSAWLAWRVESLIQAGLHSIANEFLAKGLVVLLNFSGSGLICVFALLMFAAISAIDRACLLVS
jgi:hypothetical protein